MTYTYTLTDHADENIRKQIVEPLVRFNEAQAGPSHYRPLVVVLSDAEGKVVGGMWGATGYGWLFTQLLVVPESARSGRGHTSHATGRTGSDCARVPQRMARYARISGAAVL